jgi:hypothetical protein
MLINGPKEKNPQEEQQGWEVGGKDFVRMVKAKEDYLNSMGEEASLPYYQAGLLLITSSDKKQSLEMQIWIYWLVHTMYMEMNMVMNLKIKIKAWCILILFYTNAKVCGIIWFDEFFL